MRNIKFTLALSLFMLILLSGCSSQSGNTSTSDLPYQINWSDFLKSPEELTKLSSIANSIDYIKLKTPDSVKLDFMYEINFNRGDLYILDFTFSLYIFDFDGNLKSIINHRGRGPGEYPTLNGFTIDEDENHLAFHLGSKVWFYDFQGKFIKETQIEGEDIPISIKWLGNDMFLGLVRIKPENDKDTNPVAVIVFDSNGKIVKKFRYYIERKEIQPQNLAPTPVGTLTKIQSGVLVKAPFNDTTFIIDKEMTFAPYLINATGAYRPTREYLENFDNYNYVNNSVTLKSTGYIVYNKTYLFSGNSYISFKYNDQNYQGIWNFENEMAFSIPSSTSYNGLKDDIDFGLPFVSPHIGFVTYDDPNKLIDILEPIKLLQDKSLMARENSQLAEIIKDMQIEDNSVIRILNTKVNIEAEK